MSEVKRYITCSELPADIPDVVVCATDYAALEGKYSRICESLKDSDAGMHLFLEQRNELRAEIAASDQALRESRANEVAATHMLAEVQQELAALKGGQVPVDPIAMLDLRVAAKNASPWGDTAERTGAFVAGAVWHAQQSAPALESAWVPPAGYVLIPTKCTSQLEDAYDERCRKDGQYEPGLYLPAYDAMVAEAIRTAPGAEVKS